MIVRPEFSLETRPRVWFKTQATVLFGGSPIQRGIYSNYNDGMAMDVGPRSLVGNSADVRGHAERILIKPPLVLDNKQLSIDLLALFSETVGDLQGVAATLADLESRLSTLKGRVDLLQGVLSTSIQAAIDSAIGSEVTARNGAISSAIASEVSARNSAISSAVSAEASARSSADSSLDGRTSSLETSRTTHKNKINDLIAALNSMAINNSWQAPTYPIVFPDPLP